MYYIMNEKEETPVKETFPKYINVTSKNKVMKNYMQIPFYVQSYN